MKKNDNGKVVWDPCRLNLWICSFLQGCEQLIPRQQWNPFKFFKCATSIYCPLTFYREKKQNNQGASYNNETLIRHSLVPWRTEARGTKQNKMQSFASWSLAIALSFKLGEFCQVSNPTRASSYHVFHPTKLPVMPLPIIIINKYVSNKIK